MDDDQYTEIACQCGDNCDGHFYFQPDTINDVRVIMLGIEHRYTDSYMWLTPAEARRAADDLLALVAQIESEA